VATPEIINAIYREVFGRDADPVGVSARLNMTPDEIRRDLFGSQEYANLVATRERRRDDAAAKLEKNQERQQRKAEIRAEREDAHARIKTVLERYGLSDLSKWAWEQLTLGSSEARITLELPDQPAVQKRFGAVLEGRRKAGLPAISFAEIVHFERESSELARAAGLPAGAVTRELQHKWLVNNVSIAEVGRRFSLAEQRVFNTDPVLRAERARFGVTSGEEVWHELDPKNAFPAIARRFASAGLSAQGVRTGFGPLSRREAGGLVDLGVTEDQAAQGFGTLAASRDLFAPLAGTQEREITRETQFGAVFGGSAQAREEIEKRAAKRRAPFQGGGAFTQTSEGFGGLGRSR